MSGRLITPPAAQPYQESRFTILGNPNNPEQMKRDLRVAVLEHLGLLFGLARMEEEVCPECSGELRVVLHPHAPTAFCQCGWILPIDAEDIEEDAEGLTL